MTGLQRGDLVVCALSGDYGKPRPAVVVQSDLFNDSHASTTICPVTSDVRDAPLFRVQLVPSPETGLKVPSQAMVDKLTTVKREKVRARIGHLTAAQTAELNEALKLWLELP